jgi:hypothetical protein
MSWVDQGNDKFMHFGWKPQGNKQLRIPTGNEKILNVTSEGCRVQFIGSQYNSIAVFVKTVT